MGNTLTKTGAGEMTIRNDLVTNGGTVSVQEGNLSGIGPITGDVNNSGGTISPGNSPGVLEIDGDYTQGDDGGLLIEIAGSERGVEHDLLDVSGLVTLAGSLEVQLLDGFDPSRGNHFDILDAGTLIGSFAEIQLPALVEGLGWDTSALYIDGSLAVVPEPATGSILLLVTLLCASQIRRRSLPDQIDG